jgi:hypothetical protein
MLFVGVLPLSFFQHEPFLRSASLGQGAILDRRMFPLPQKYFHPLSSAQNSVIEFKTQIVIKFNLQSISYV